MSQFLSGSSVVPVLLLESLSLAFSRQQQVDSLQVADRFIPLRAKALSVSGVFSQFWAGSSGLLSGPGE
jgi:hypothetical protein